MALKKKPVTGMKDILPKEMAIRDYVIRLIKETYGTFGFISMETPCVEHIENLKCFERGRKLVCVVGIVTAERNGQVITQAAVYEIVFFLSGLEFQLLSSF